MRKVQGGGSPWRKCFTQSKSFGHCADLNLYIATDSLLNSRSSEKLINLSLLHIMRGGSNATPSSMEIGKMFLVVNTQDNKCEVWHNIRQHGPFCLVWSNQYRHVAGV